MHNPTNLNPSDVQVLFADLQKQMETQRAAMQKQIEDAKAKIKPFLTADQQKELDAMPVPGPRPPPPPDQPNQDGGT